MCRAGVKSEAKKEVAGGLPTRRARKLAGRPVYEGDSQTARRAGAGTGADCCEYTNTALTAGEWTNRICNHDEAALLDSRKTVFAAGPLGICRDWNLVSAGNPYFPLCRRLGPSGCDSQRRLSEEKWRRNLGVVLLLGPVRAVRDRDFDFLFAGAAALQPTGGVPYAGWRTQESCNRRGLHASGSAHRGAPPRRWFALRPCGSRSGG